MTAVERLADFVTRASFDRLSTAAREQLKIHVLDALGCALGALDGAPIRMLKGHVTALSVAAGEGGCTLIGGGHAAPDRAAFFNSALVRYLDFNDSYLAEGETCHPSDNLGAILAATEYMDGDGHDLLTALAVAYQVQCRLSDVAPVRAKGFDHTTQGSYAVAAGVARALRLDRTQTAHALAIAGTALNALRVTRTGALSHWKGLAYPHTAWGATHAAFLARAGITGPLEVFEGNKGFMDAIAGRFEIDWEHEDLERVTRTIIKKYNAEIHSQSAIEGLLELKHAHGFTGADVARVEVDIFDVAYHIIGGGEEGDKTLIRTKEEADHSLPYMLAVALLDDEVLPAQYEPERIGREDVQGLLRKITIRPSSAFSARFPDEMVCRIAVKLNDGSELALEKVDYEGFHTRPMSWKTVERKFHALAERYLDASTREQVVTCIAELGVVPIRELMMLLSRAKASAAVERKGAES